MIKNKKITTIPEAVAQIQDGDRLVLGHAAVSPNCIIDELERQAERFTNLSIFQLIFFGEERHLSEKSRGHMRVCTPFMASKELKRAVNTGEADFIPCHFSRVPGLFRKGGTYEPDWAIVMVTPPDEEGRYSCSLSSDFTLPAARAAKKVLAVVNPSIPYVGGDNFLREDEIDVMVLDDTPAHTVPKSNPSELDTKIAEYCASLVPDRACLQLGIGALPDAVLGLLKSHKDLGIHTELLTPGVLDLYQSGAITGAYKGVHKEKIVAAFTMGDTALYEWLDRNPVFEQYPVDYVNDPYLIGQNPKMISINSCVEIDLYGQVCSEKVGGRMFSGSGGQFDYVRGVRLSEGGVSIIATPSTAKGGTISRIQPFLTQGNVVTTHRNDVDYIITEYGIASLHGRSEWDRAQALISIAHPDYRDELERQAYAQFGRKVVY